MRRDDGFEYSNGRDVQDIATSRHFVKELMRPTKVSIGKICFILVGDVVVEILVMKYSRTDRSRVADSNQEVHDLIADQEADYPD
jgi:hypothetical protein